METVFVLNVWNEIFYDNVFSTELSLLTNNESLIQLSLRGMC